MSRTIVVTGANRGLGNELVKLLLTKGDYHIIATARRWTDASRSLLLNEVKIPVGNSGSSSTISSSRIEFIDLEITQEASRTEAINRIQTLLHPPETVNILVNNAGIFPQLWNPVDFSNAWLTNTVGPLKFALAMVPLMLPAVAKGSTSSSTASAASFIPHVINVSSGLGKLSQISPSYQKALETCITLDSLLTTITYEQGKHDKFMNKGYAPAYCLSKASLNRGTQLLANTYKDQLRVTSVDPGWCSTDMGTMAAPRTPQQGAESIYNAVKDEKGGLDNGQYLSSTGVPMEW